MIMLVIVVMAMRVLGAYERIADMRLSRSFLLFCLFLFHIRSTEKELLLCTNSLNANVSLAAL